MKTNRARLGILVAGLLAAGCSDTNLIALAEPASGMQFTVTGATGSQQTCYAVQGMIHGDVSDPVNPVAIITGDLEGSVATMLAPDPVGGAGKFITGRTIHIAGSQSIEVTGGSIPELVGVTIAGTLETRAIHLPPIRRVSNTLTLTSGATGHLTSHGIIDLLTLTTSFVYEGTVCS